MVQVAAALQLVALAAWVGALVAIAHLKPSVAPLSRHLTRLIRAHRTKEPEPCHGQQDGDHAARHQGQPPVGPSSHVVRAFRLEESHAIALGPPAWSESLNRL